MKKLSFFFSIFIFLCLINCNTAQVLLKNALATPGRNPAVSPSGLSLSSPTITSSSAVNPTSTPKHLLSPTETSSPTINSPTEEIRRSLSDLILSSDWPIQGLSAERKELWESFAASSIELEVAEAELLSSFLSQWQNLSSLKEKPVIPAGAEPLLRVAEKQDEKGKPFLVLFAIELASSEDGGPRHFLVARDRLGVPGGWVLSPSFNGLNQRVSVDGLSIEYLDKNNNLLLTADARILDQSVKREVKLQQMMEENHLSEIYTSQRTYPRFHFNIPGVDSAFYGIEDLTNNQILLLKSTLEIFNRDDFVELEPEIFPAGDRVDFIVSRIPHPYAAALALPLGGTPRQGIVVLYSKNLFDNRYVTASSIAHEAAHIWQGNIPGCDDPQTRMMKEVGKMIIPAGFLNWTAPELYDAVISEEIGAYHISYWMLTKLNQIDQAHWIVDVIQTGRANGIPVNGCESQRR